MRKEFEGRTQFTEKEIEDWYDFAKADEIKNGVVWINEPHHFEDVYSYLVQGKNKDLLIDTGMGIKPIYPLLEQIRDPLKELLVANTHWHFDHIGGNYEFEEVFIPDNQSEKDGVNGGWTKQMMDEYYFSDGFGHNKNTRPYPSTFNLKNFSIKGYSNVKPLPGQFDLGNRIIRVINTPGHTQGSISFFDETYGLLFPGDTLYEGPLYIFDDKESSPDQYLTSLLEISKLPIKIIHPGHNHSDTKNFPNLIPEVIDLLFRAKNKEPWDGQGEFDNTVEYWHPNYNPKAKNGRRLKIVVKKIDF